MIESDTLAAVIEKHIKTAVDHSVESYIEKTIASLVLDPDWVIKVETLVNQNFQRKFNERLSTIDFASLIKEHIDAGVERWQAKFRKNFSTKGISDQATSTQLTVMDDLVVVQHTFDCENLTAEKDLQVKGTLTVNNLCLRGSVNTDNASWTELISHMADETMRQITDQWREQLVAQVLDLARTQGIDFAKVSIGGEPMIDGNRLNARVTESNLEKLGALKELRVLGTAEFNTTMTVNIGRVGVNTDAPEMALGVWDEEVSLVFGKHSLNHGFLGTSRAQSLSLGVNRQCHVTIDNDGLTTVKALRINQHQVAFATQVPGYSGTRGDIVFNSDPKPGQPFAWQCLGGYKWQTLKAVV